jgi:hypothetical protein
MGGLAVQRVEGMDIDDCVDRVAIIGQCKKAVAILATDLIAIYEQEAPGRAANEGHLRADVDQACNPERAPKIPEVVS